MIYFAKLEKGTLPAAYIIGSVSQPNTPPAKENDQGGASCNLDVSSRALDMFRELEQKYGARQLVVLIDDTGCCGFSNVFVTKSPVLNPSSWKETGKVLGIPLLVNKAFASPTNEQRIILDVIANSSSDDSFSLETAYGKRFVVMYSERC